MVFGVYKSLLAGTSTRQESATTASICVHLVRFYMLIYQYRHVLLKLPEGYTLFAVDLTATHWLSYAIALTVILHRGGSYE